MSVKMTSNLKHRADKKTQADKILVFQKNR